jgi:hypothetical protein
MAGGKRPQGWVSGLEWIQRTGVTKGMADRRTAAGREATPGHQPPVGDDGRRRRVRPALALAGLLLLLAPAAVGLAARQAQQPAAQRAALRQQNRAAALEQRAAARRARLEAARAAREAARARRPRLVAPQPRGGQPLRPQRSRNGHGHGWRGPYRENAIVLSTCTVVHWHWRKFPNMPNNLVHEYITIGHMAPFLRQFAFRGEEADQFTPINPRIGRNRIDTGAKWKGNGVQGGFDIHSGKKCPPAPAFTIEKKQRIGSSATFTKAPLTGLVGQIVEYEMIVQNTGNVPLVFSNFTDPNCEPGTIKGGPGTTPLQPGPTPEAGEKSTFTCTHQLTSTERYENVASVTGTPEPGKGSAATHESNIVIVNGPPPPAELTIEKRQKIETGEYTTSPLEGKVGQTVEYEIIVTDTGNTQLTLSAFTDANCEGITGGPSKALEPTESTTYLCHHLLTSADQTAGSHTNEASVTGTPPGVAPITKTSNKVVVTLEPIGAPGLSIEKRQKIETGEYTTSPLEGKVGQTVEYEIIVTDTGNTSLTLSGFTDANCEGITGGPSKALEPTESTSYFCHHLLTSADQTAGSRTNEASVTGTPPGGSPIPKNSNQVVVTLKAPTSRPLIYLAYADTAPNDRGGPSGLPSPWKGSAGVIFESCGFGGTDNCPTSGGHDVYDAGAIRIEATSSSGPVSVGAASVTVGPCKYEPWPGLNATLQPGQSLILSQTGQHPRCTSTSGTEQDNFDTSESFLLSPQYQQFLKTGKCTNDGYIPAIKLTLNSATTNIADSGQVLNGGGQDADLCRKTSEAVGWVKLAPSSGAAARYAAAPQRTAKARHRRRSHRASRANIIAVRLLPAA